jgi:hypothetical protein
VVGHVEDLDDLGNLLPDHRLDALLQRDVRHPAPLAATPHLEVDHPLSHVEERDDAAVPSHRGIDRGVEELLHLFPDEGVGLLPHGRRGVFRRGRNRSRGRRARGVVSRRGARAEPSPDDT